MSTETVVRIQPHDGRQTEFLSSDADMTFFGGAAGGGKTFALLLEPLRHVANGRFRAVIIRRTGTEITDEGGLADESAMLYPHLSGEFSQKFLRWTFPSGARVRFRHLQNKDYVSEWKGTQAALLGFDQVEDTEEAEFFYICSRLRSVSGVRPYIRCTCNPDPDSWVATFLDWWIGEDGYPLEERAGKKRWVVRDVHGEFIWGDTPDEVVALARQKGTNNPLPRSVTFIPAKLDDNPTLMQINPEYEAMLEALSPVERMRLKHGNWKVRQNVTTDWSLDLFPEDDIIAEWPANIEHTVQQLDPAYGKKKGDYQALWGLGTRGDGILYAEARMLRLGLQPLADAVVAQAQGMPRWPLVTMVEENTFKHDVQGALGQKIDERARLQGRDLNVHAVHPTFHMMEKKIGLTDLKRTRIRHSLDALIRGRRIRWVESPGTRVALSQIKDFPLAKNDDGPDALARGVDTLTQLAEELYGDL